jgi:hypothetical protein
LSSSHNNNIIYHPSKGQAASFETPFIISPLAMLEEVRKIMMEAPPGKFESVLNNITVIAEKSGIDFLSVTDETKELHEAMTGRCFLNNDSVREEDSSHHPMAVAMKEQLASYKEKFYSATPGVSMRFHVVAKGSSNLIVTSYAERVDDTNCYCGSWFAQWKIQTTESGPSSSEASMSGNVVVKAYSYEDTSNIQLQTIMDFAETAVVVHGNNHGGDLLFCGGIMAQISTWEGQVIGTLQEMYDGMNDKLKSLRRTLPITRTRMDWNVITHRMVKTLGASQK